MSSTDISIFRRSGVDIRVVMIDNEPWWVAADVATMLGYRMAADLTRTLDDDEKGTRVMRTPGGEQPMGIISEGGLFKAIVQRQTGRLVDAYQVDAIKAFQRWVTHEVLPEIRKTGSYVSPTPEVDLALPHDYVSALEALLDRERANVALTLENQTLAPRATAWDALASADGDFSVADAAKTISRNGHSIGGQRLFEFMHQINWVFRGADTKWRCYQHAVDKGYIATKLQFHYHPATGDRVVDVPQVRITAKGVNRLSQRLQGHHLEVVGA